MQHKKTFVVTLILIALVVVLGGVFAKPLIAQVRATLIRDTDNPALAPFRGRVDYDLCCTNDGRLMTTVPAGKRLVIEYISWNSFTSTGDEMIFAGLQSGAGGTFVVQIKINPVHSSIVPSFKLQDGSQTVKAYFDAGEQVWVNASHMGTGTAHLTVLANGYYVTP